MKKIFLLFAVQLAVLSYNTAFSQDTATTLNDALDFIKTNLNQSSNTNSLGASSNFYEIFSDKYSSNMNYSYSEQTSYTVISAESCIIKLVESITGNTRISYTEDDENPDEPRLYSDFIYLKQDTVTVDFSKISKIESGTSSITFISYNNNDLIEHKGQITQTPPKKRKNDLVSFLKSEEEDLYIKLKKFLVKNNINYTVSPQKTERFNTLSSRFTLNNIDREKCRRLIKAFNFVQKKCGAPKEKF